MPDYAEVQPRDGDLVLHCGHVGSGRKFHFFRVPDGIEFTAPDGTHGEARWIAQCTVCVEFNLPEDRAFIIAGADTWVGDEPELTVAPYDDRPKRLRER